MNTSRVRAILCCGALAIAVCLVFGPGLFGGFVWDDGPLIVENRFIQDQHTLPAALTHDLWFISSGAAPEGLAGRYYRPLVTLTFAFEHAVSGRNPIFYHALSVALHLAVALMAFQWVRRRMPASARTDLWALVAVGCFALHPCRVESVTWISGVSDLLLAFWTLAGLTLWSLRTRWATVLALVSFALAAASKEPGFLIPVMLAVDNALRPPAPLPRSLVRSVGPWVSVMAVAFVRLFLVPFQAPDATDEGVLLGLMRFAATTGRCVATTVWLHPLSAQVGYLHRDALGRVIYPDWAVGIGALSIFALVCLVVRARHDASARPWLADLAWFVIPLAPALNVVPLGINVLVAPRFLYLPSLGVAALMARGLVTWDERSPRSAVARVLLVTALVCAEGAATVDHIGHFSSDDALWTWEHTLDPSNPDAAGILAEIRAEQGRFDEALVLAVQASASARAQQLREPAIRSTWTALRILLLATPDDDRSTLAAIHRLLESTAAEPGRQHQIETARGRVVIDAMSVDEARRVVNSAAFGVLRASAAARDLDLTRAEAMLRAVTQREPLRAAAWRELMLVTASEERWAESALNGRRAMWLSPAHDPGRSILHFIDSAPSQIAAAPTPLVGRANVHLQLRETELVRRTLAPAMALAPGDATLRALWNAASLRDRVAHQRGIHTDGPLAW